MLCQSVAAVLAAILAVLALTQRIEVWHVYVIALALEGMNRRQRHDLVAVICEPSLVGRSLALAFRVAEVPEEQA